MLKKDLALTKCQVKFSQDKPRQFSGYASVFGNVDAYGDTILPGAYKDTLKERDFPVMMFFGHSPGRVLGKWVDLEEDDVGLKATGELTPGNADSENTLALLKHGALSGLSIGYNVPAGGSSTTDDGRRLLSKIDLVEISVVSLPADTSARVDLTSIKSLLEEAQSLSELEDHLRDVGNFSRSSAKAFLARVRQLALRDAGVSEEAKADLSWLKPLPNFSLE
jgi:hypothetical protein